MEEKLCNKYVYQINWHGVSSTDGVWCHSTGTSVPTTSGSAPQINGVGIIDTYVQIKKDSEASPNWYQKVRGVVGGRCLVSYYCCANKVGFRSSPGGMGMRMDVLSLYSQNESLPPYFLAQLDSTVGIPLANSRIVFKSKKKKRRSDTDRRPAAGASKQKNKKQNSREKYVLY